MLHNKMALVHKLLNNADLHAYSTLQNSACDANMRGGGQWLLWRYYSFILKSFLKRMFSCWWSLFLFF